MLIVNILKSLPIIFDNLRQRLASLIFIFLIYQKNKLGIVLYNSIFFRFTVVNFTVVNLYVKNHCAISKIESGKFNCSIDYLSKFSWFLGFEIVVKQ
jgi:hypothetical protein